MAEHPFLGPRFVLKGGTALNLYHDELPRLSVDADLNYVGAVSIERMEAERQQVLHRIEALAQEIGYTVHVLQDSYALRMYRLAYQSANGGTDHIKLDLNFVERLPVLVPIDERAPPASLQVEGPRVRCLRLDELAGSKVATLLLRGACRDLFDVARLASRKDIDWDVAGKVALFHGALDHVRLENLDVKRVHGITQAGFDRDVRNLLRKGNDVTLEQIRDDATPVVEKVLQEIAEEPPFLDALEDGRWEPDLLFKGLKVHPDLKRHPAMEWRLKNPYARLPR